MKCLNRWAICQNYEYGIFWRTLVIRQHNSIKEILNYDQRCKHVNINECKLHCSLLHGNSLKVANKTPASAPWYQVFTICPLCSPPLVFCPLPAERQISKHTATLSTWSTAETATAPDSPTPFLWRLHQYQCRKLSRQRGRHLWSLTFFHMLIV